MSDENKTPSGQALPNDLTDEERRRLEKYSKLEQNKAKRTAIVVSVTVFLIVMFLGGVAGGLVYLSGYEAPQALPDGRTAFSPLPTSPSDILAELVSLMPDTADTKSVKLSAQTGVGISDEFTVASGRDYLINEVALIRGSVAQEISDFDTNYNSAFGDDFTDLLPQLGFDADSVNSVTCEDAPDASGTGKIWRTFTFSFGEADFEAAAANKELAVFELDKARAVFERFTSNAAAMFTVDNSTVHCDALIITARADAFTGVLDSITLKRAYTVSADVTFTGEYAAVGTDSFLFRVASDEIYSFEYAGIDISKSELFTEKGKSDEIIRTVTTDEAHNEVKIVWSSSNPEILSVDEKGYFKAHNKSVEPVIVTAQYTYLGVTYSDTCKVYVREPVKSVKVDRQKLTLAVGEKETLSAALKPENATLTDIFWFSEDETIAVVDKNTGEITAVAPGTVKIYCITFDGNFRDSCILTVTG